MPFALSVSQRASQGEEGACTEAAGQLHKKLLAWRVMGRSAVSTFWPSLCSMWPPLPATLTHPAADHLPLTPTPLSFMPLWNHLHMALTVLCAFFLLRSFLLRLRGSHDNNKSSFLLDKDDLFFPLSNQAVTESTLGERSFLPHPLFICGYQLNEWMNEWSLGVQTALELKKNTNAL